jgi:hypothetical protein
LRVLLWELLHVLEGVLVGLHELKAPGKDVEHRADLRGVRERERGGVLKRVERWEEKSAVERESVRGSGREDRGRGSRRE